MKTWDYIIKSFLSAAGVVIYVFFIAALLSHAEGIFGEPPPEVFIPVFMMLLFVVSASITGLMVLGKPIHLYMGGHKKEAFVLLFATIGWLILFLIKIAVILILLK